MFYTDVRSGLALRQNTDSVGATSAKKNTVNNSGTQLSETLCPASSFACYLAADNPNLKAWHIYSIYAYLMALSVDQAVHF
jgi:hypothetical protein